MMNKLNSVASLACFDNNHSLALSFIRSFMPGPDAQLKQTLFQFINVCISTTLF